MAKVKALLDCFVDNNLRKEGDVFFYDGPRSDCFELLEGEFADEQAQPARRGRKPKLASDVIDSVI